MTTISIAILACLLQVYGHIVYNKGNSSPNLTSWTIWAFTSIIDTLNYSEMTGDWQKNILSITCSIACFVTWFLCLLKGRFSRPKKSEYMSFVVCLVAIYLWKEFGLVKESNMILQVDNVISFLPIIYIVYKYPNTEQPRAWIVWTFSYALGTVVVLMRYIQWQDLVYPASCVVLHLAVGILSLRTTKNTKAFINTAT